MLGQQKTKQEAGTAISSATTTATIATIIVVVTGAPPYLVFIVQIQQYKFSCFSHLCQVFLMKKQILVSIYKLALFLRRVIVTVHSVLSNTLRDAQNLC